MNFWQFLDNNFWEIILALGVVSAVLFGWYTEYTKQQQQQLKLQYCISQPNTEFCKDLK